VSSVRFTTALVQGERKTVVGIVVADAAVVRKVLEAKR
jgi:hypothetical protein